MAKKVCPRCGREYSYPICEFCARLDVWNDHPLKEHLRGHFTPRMMKELEDCSSLALREYVFETIDNMEKTTGAGIYIWNNAPRTGKTVFAMFLFVEYMRRAYINNTSRSLMFTSMLDLLDAEKKFNAVPMYERYAVNSPIESAQCAPFLVLDDFGTDKGFTNPATYETTYKLINYRYEYLLPTVFTSNNSLEGLASIMDDARIPSRIGRMCSQVINFNFKNL